MASTHIYKLKSKTDKENLLSEILIANKVKYYKIAKLNELNKLDTDKNKNYNDKDIKDDKKKENKENNTPSLFCIQFLSLTNMYILTAKSDNGINDNGNNGDNDNGINDNGNNGDNDNGINDNGGIGINDNGDDNFCYTIYYHPYSRIVNKEGCIFKEHRTSDDFTAYLKNRAFIDHLSNIIKQNNYVATEESVSELITYMMDNGGRKFIDDNKGFGETFSDKLKEFYYKNKLLWIRDAYYFFFDVYLPDMDDVENM